ncbi:MAG: 5-methyltetrahydrofolate--homocysteine methyltransferase [Paludibacteraceae bacterium]|nr:5-methyltetrahydrofolate--homocysteine methyltransferase [Paludibacteraceae bacterium]
MQKGITIIQDIDVLTIEKYINWRYFFNAWGLIGDFQKIEKEDLTQQESWVSQFPLHIQSKAIEAFQLFVDAQKILLEKNQTFKINAIVGLFPVSAKEEDIYIKTPDTEKRIPMLRQQTLNEKGVCFSLADFLDAEHNYIACFATSVQQQSPLKNDADPYNTLLLQTLSDRLVEATTEWLHEQVRKTIWGFAPNENISIEDMKRSRYQGIRPAIGYPSLPDQSLIFEMAEILPLHKIGISLTENGAMNPASSVCGLIFSNPKAEYFMIKAISKEQFEDYAMRRGIPVDELKRFVRVEIVE